MQKKGGEGRERERERKYKRESKTIRKDNSKYISKKNFGKKKTFRRSDNGLTHVNE